MSKTPVNKVKVSVSLRNPKTLVTIVVVSESPDEEKEEFIVRKDFACYYCPVLKKAFDSAFVEGQTQTYTLEDTTKQAVRLLIHWFYTQNIDSVLGCAITEDISVDNFYAEVCGLAELWVLADRLLIRPLQNRAMRQIDDIILITHMTPLSTFNYIWSKACVGSPLRSIMLHHCANCLDATTFAQFPEAFPHAMLIDLTILLVIHRENLETNIEDFCVRVDE